MPELPEVEFGRALAESIALHQTIVAVRCANDAIVFDGVSPRRINAALVGKRIEAVNRHGKQLWFTLDQPPHPLFHFGMTGAFHTPRGDVIRLASSRKRNMDSVWPPRFAKIHLRFDNGGKLVMTDPRRLGRIRLRHDPPNESPIADLGFDPLQSMPSLARFSLLLREKRGNIKGVLLDQSFSAGVGNWIADEVLFQARIDPRRAVSSLSDTETRTLHRALRSVIRIAVKAHAQSDRYPPAWLFHHRWGRNAQARINSGERIEHITVAGRTTAWVPTLQT